LVSGVALFAAVGVSSASAANWDPQGREVSATLATGTTSSLTAGGATVTCTGVDTRLATTVNTPNVATTTHGIHNPVQFTGCTSFGGPADVTTFGTWSFTAIDTTTVTGAATNGASAIATIQPTAITGCVVSIFGADIPNNDWNNTTHNLAINNQATFPVSANASCLGAVGTVGRLHGIFNVPEATIT
jgi:hypothetical protein